MIKLAIKTLHLLNIKKKRNCQRFSTKQSSHSQADNKVFYFCTIRYKSYNIITSQNDDNVIKIKLIFLIFDLQILRLESSILSGHKHLLNNLGTTQITNFTCLIYSEETYKQFYTFPGIGSYIFRSTKLSHLESTFHFKYDDVSDLN